MRSSNRRASSADTQVGTCTPLVMADRSLRRRTPGQIGAHISRVTSPCSWLTPLTRRRAQRQRRHVEQRAAAVVVVAERQERFAIGAERSPGAGEVLLDQVERETRRGRPAPACAS